MANQPDPLATVRTALSSKIGGSCRCHLNGPGGFEVCHSCEALAYALRNAAPAIADLCREVERLRAKLTEARELVAFAEHESTCAIGPHGPEQNSADCDCLIGAIAAALEVPC